MSVHREKQTRESKSTNETGQGGTRNKTFEFAASPFSPHRHSLKIKSKFGTTADETLDKSSTLLLFRSILMNYSMIHELFKVSYSRVY